MVLKRLLGVLPGLALAFSVSVAAAQAPNVVVSIKPVHSLIAGVMEGLGTPYLIVKGVASPHDYALKPSDAGELERAHMVFWIGPGLEGFLVKPLEALASRAHIIEFASEPIVGNPAAAKESDLHFWLDPRKARAMAALAVAQLSAMDPNNTPQYRANGLHLSQRIDNLEVEMRILLSPVRNIPFIVSHNAFSHMERAYGLNVAGSIATNPELPPGARRIAELRNKIRTLGVRCLFREPQFDPALVYTLAEGQSVGIGFLDAIGGARLPGPDLYFHLMLSNAESLFTCLGGS